MNVGELFAPEWIALWVTGTALLALAAILFVLDVGNRAQRVFALLLGLRGLTFVMGPLRGEASTPAETVMWTNLGAYAVLPLVPLTLYFLLLYPRPRGLATRRWGPWAVLAATLGILIWYLLDHSAYGVAVAPAGTYASYGPLFILVGLRLPVFALAGLVLARAYRREPSGSKGFSLFLMVAAFTLNALYDGTLAVMELVGALQNPGPIWLPFGWTRWVLPVLALPIGLATCATLLPVLRQARNDPELQEVTRFFFAAVPLALATPFVRLLPYDGAAALATFVLAVWRLAIPFLIAYALMRYQLFDIDIRIKAGIRRGIIVGAFTATFFLVSEAAEALLQGERGPLFGIVGAGALAFLSRPVRSFAGRAADRFMPDTKPIAQQSHGERLRFYLGQFELINQDGEVTTKERRMLDRLRRTLALDPQDVSLLERTGRLPPDDAPGPSAEAVEEPGTKDSRLEVAIKGALVAGALASVFAMLSQGSEAIIPVSNGAAGLVASIAVAFLLGPLETLADRLTHRMNPKAATDAKDAAERRRAFEAALETALEDGHLSARDLRYLGRLQERLRISWATRWRLERRAQRRLAA